MKLSEKPRETFQGIQCIGTPVMVEKHQVGFAPVPEVPEITLEGLRDVGFSDNTIASLAYRMAGIDVRNRVAGLYNGAAKKELSASKAIELIASGEINAEEATELMNAKKITFTQACFELAGIGEESLEKADPTRWHWVTMKSVVK